MQVPLLTLPDIFLFNVPYIRYKLFCAGVKTLWLPPLGLMTALTPFPHFPA